MIRNISIISYQNEKHEEKKYRYNHFKKGYH